MAPPPQGDPETAPTDPAESPAVEALQQRLGIRIPDPQLALAALTHKSFVNEHRGAAVQDNERLEFLGDAVLDLAVSQRLMERFPDAREGELSKIRAAVVDEAGLAVMARELDLGPLLRLGRGEEMTGGRQKSSLLADAMEAVIAAIYLGGGLGPALAVIDRFLDDAFARAAAGTLDRDYKTQLQELAQSRLRATPRYRVVAEHGPDHSKVFDVELEVRGEVIGRGAGRSKKDAEQAAAKRALQVFGDRGANGEPQAAAPEPGEGAGGSAPAEPAPGGGGAPPGTVAGGEARPDEDGGPAPGPDDAADAPAAADGAQEHAPASAAAQEAPGDADALRVGAPGADSPRGGPPTSGAAPSRRAARKSEVRPRASRAPAERRNRRELGSAARPARSTRGAANRATAGGRRGTTGTRSAAPREGQARPRAAAPRKHTPRARTRKPAKE